MPFSQAIKLEVKRKSHFTCCWCRDRQRKVDIHHIVPQADGGADELDNAAPLCGACHDLYGNNPDLRKEIRLRRDHWYELCGGEPSVRIEGPAEPLVASSKQPVAGEHEVARDATRTGTKRGASRRARRVFISYSHRDESLRQELEEHLALLRREKWIRVWHDREIGAGEEWRGQIDDELEKADLILLLVSSAFIASDYCWDVEATRALDRHARGEARVIPVIVRACDWRSAPFAELQALPTDGEPVSRWDDRDAAWFDVVQGLRRALAEERDRREVAAGDVEAGGAPRRPRYRDDESRELSERLKKLYDRRKQLTIAGEATHVVEGEILDVRRLLRKGPQLRPGKFLLMAGRPRLRGLPTADRSGVGVRDPG